MKRRSTFSLRALALAAITALGVTALPQTVQAQSTVSYAGNIRGSFSGSFSGDYVISIENNSKIYFVANITGVGELLALGTINPQTGDFTASSQNGDDVLNITGNAQVDSTDSAIIHATGTYSGQFQGFPISGSFSGSGRREVVGAFSISGMVYFNRTSPDEPDGASFPSPIGGWYIRLFRNGKLVGFTTSAADGTYSFTGRTNGEYEARARPFGQFANPIHKVKVNGANITNVNFRSNAVYVYVVDELGAGLGGIPVRITGTSNLGYKLEESATTDETTKRIALFAGNGTFIVKPKAEEGFIFDPPSRTVTLPGQGSAKPSIRVKFTRRTAPTATKKASDKSF